MKSYFLTFFLDFFSLIHNGASPRFIGNIDEGQKFTTKRRLHVQDP